MWLVMDRAEALNIFRSQHDDERKWLPYEWEAHDRLLARIEAENARIDKDRPVDRADGTD